MKVEFNWRDYDDYAKWLQDILTTLYEENEQLKHNRDKAIEYINIETQGCEENPLEGSWLYDLYLIRDILKGDSDDE